MLANLGSAHAPSSVAGLTFSLERQTIGGVMVRAETWIGARPGLECVATCRPNQRIYSGQISDGISLQQERIFIRNLVIAGIVNNLYSEFEFFAEEIFAPTLKYLEWNQSLRVPLLNLTFNNTTRFDGNLVPRYDSLIASYAAGNLTVTAVLYFYQRVIDVELIVSFGIEGFTIASDLVICSGEAFGCANGFDRHEIYLSVAVWRFICDMRLIFPKIFGNLMGAWLDITLKLGSGVKLINSYVIDAGSLVALSVRYNWEF
jgi:hypothetical protein